MALRVDEIWAYVASDESGDEGIVSAPIGAMIFPLVCAEKKQMERMRPFAIMAAAARRRSVSLVRFETRTEIEVIEP